MLELRKLERDVPKQALCVGTKKSIKGRVKMTINGRSRRVVELEFISPNWKFPSLKYERGNVLRVDGP